MFLFGLFFFTQGFPLTGQQNFECHTGSLNADGSNLLDSEEPSCWPDYFPPCEENIGFAPNADHPEDTPIKFIRVVLHFFQNWNDPFVIHPPGNFTNSQEHMDVIRSWFHHPVRGINARLANICDPLPKVPGNESPHIPDARVRFLYEGIENEDVFFYNDPELWAGGYYCCNLGGPRADMISKAITNNPAIQASEDLRNALHVFYTGVSIGPNEHDLLDCECETMPSYSGGGYTSFGCSPTNNIVQYATYYTYQYNKTGVSTWLDYNTPPDPAKIPEGGSGLLAEWLHVVSVDHPTNSQSHLNIPSGSNDQCDDTPSFTTINNMIDGTFDADQVDKCGLTQCQMGRMHRFMEMIKPPYVRSEANNFQYPPPYFDCELVGPDLEIAANQTVIWDQLKTLYSNVIVRNGAKLTINCDVLMPEMGRIIIEPNAELILNGRITAGCNSWQGIEVWGDNSQSQYSIGGVRAQGRFVGKSGSVIENAETAIKLYGPTYNDAGGQITCSGTTFLNNSTAIEFAPYQNYWPFATSQQGQPRSYFGSLSDCTFLVNDDYTVSTSFNAFISMTAVNGVLIYGSSFTNAQSPSSGNVQGYGFGIIASESGFRVDALCTGNTYPCNSFDRSSFTGLGYGIQISNVTTSRPYILKQTDFTDCYFGLHNTGVSNATVLFNTFNLGQVPNPGASEDQIGIFLEMGLAGFTLQENEFIGTSGNVSNTAGTYCRHLDEFNNEIRRNTYIGLDVGNLAEGDNATSPLNKEERGLNYLCNYNDDISTADFWVGDVFGTNRIRQSQGLQEEAGGQINYSAAGNRFAYTGFDFDNEGEAVDYYYYEQGAQEKPLTFFSITE